MKKPKYTRQTKCQLPKIAEQYTVSEVEESVARLSARRKWAIDTLTAKKLIYTQEEVGEVEWMLRVKKSININLRANKKILKSILRKNRNKPLGVLQRVHPSTKAEVIELVRNSPVVVEYLEKLFTDIESGPFKGLFGWTAGISTSLSFWDEGPRLWITLCPFDNIYRIYNRIAAFRIEFDKIALHNFKVFDLPSLESL